MEERKSITAGKNNAFLVCHKSFTETDSEFVRWLRSEGFHLGDHHGNFGNCPWMYVDISQKLYAYGMPGINMMAVIGNHAITLEEFRTIYEIYRKYKGKEVFVFHAERFDYDVD